MATDVATVVKQLQTALQQIEPDIDVKKGPMLRLFINPHAGIVSAQQDKIDRLIGIFTLNRVDNILTSELDAQSAAFSGMGRFQGRKSTGFVTFFTKTKPNTNIVINIGDQVADATSSLVYRVTQQVIISPNDFIRFFNPITQRFEFLAPVEAMSIGADYDIPSGRIKRILGTISGIDGVTNSDAISGGASVEDNASFNARFQKRLEGQSLGTKGGLISEIVNIPGVLDLSLVTSENPDLFSRRSNRPCIDAYVLGYVEGTDTVSFTVSSNKIFTLPAHRITSITSVTLDGADVTDYAFIRDTSNLAGSVKEVDKIELRAQPVAGSVVEISFTYNALLETVQDRASQFNDFAYFGVDFLAYEAIQEPLVVSYEFAFLSSFDKNTIMSALQTETMSYLNPNVFAETLQPTAFVAYLQKKVPAAVNITLKTFTTKNHSLAAIETCTFAKNAYPVLSSSDLTINIKA
jgi:hypothetical protein